MDDVLIITTQNTKHLTESFKLLELNVVSLITTGFVRHSLTTQKSKIRTVYIIQKSNKIDTLIIQEFMKELRINNAVLSFNANRIYLKQKQEQIKKLLIDNQAFMICLEK